LENWINFSSTRHGGVGPSYTFLAIIGQARHDVEYYPSGSYKLIPNKWQPKIPSLLPSYGTSYGIKHKARKEVASVWSIIHKVVAVNEWHGKISIDINKKIKCPRCGSSAMELVRHRFSNCPLAQQVWRYAANVMWSFFVKKSEFGPRKSFSLLQCLFDQSLNKALKSFSRIWLFLKSGMSWVIGC
jgi:hypothetical protein